MNLKQARRVSRTEDRSWRRRKMGPKFVGLSILMSALLVGCGSDEDPKASHFEHDHLVAAHWPNDLADLSAKLRARVASFETGARVYEDDDHEDEHDHDDDHETVSLREQIEDLVDWVGEVAADTNLSEADWIPLYEMSEAISASLKSNSGDLSKDNVRELESLCELIDQASQAIPDQLPSLTRVDS